MHVRAALTRPGLELSSLDRVLWPSTGFTKGEMLDYYAGVARVMLPHLADRPLTLGRFPAGVEGRGFAQIECRGHPEWVATAGIRLRDGRLRHFCLAHDADSLLWIANLGTIELHTFLGSVKALGEPTAVLFDLDPEPPAGFPDAAQVALTLREWLAARRLTSLVKTTGGAGLHVIVPLNTPHSYAATREFARAAALELAGIDPRISASAVQRAARAGTVLIDWAQNSERRTIIAPYSLRASELPSVATPISWTELEDPAARMAALRFGPAEVLARVEQRGDIFRPALETVQRIF
jgi:bifunctional non-homologous end joining protein LigD